MLIQGEIEREERDFVLIDLERDSVCLFLGERKRGREGGGQWWRWVGMWWAKEILLEFY